MIRPSGPGFVQDDYSLEEALASVGPGWAGIVHALVDFLKGHGVKIHQVKEKFGRLTVYVDYYDDVVETARLSAEAASMVTCEDCGLPGRVQGGVWLLTLCDDCAARQGMGGKR